MKLLECRFFFPPPAFDANGRGMTDGAGMWEKKGKRKLVWRGVRERERERERETKADTHLSQEGREKNPSSLPPPRFTKVDQETTSLCSIDEKGKKEAAAWMNCMQLPRQRLKKKKRLSSGMKLQAEGKDKDRGFLPSSFPLGWCTFDAISSLAFASSPFASPVHATVGWWVRRKMLRKTFCYYTEIPWSEISRRTVETRYWVDGCDYCPKAESDEWFRGSQTGVGRTSSTFRGS